MLAYVAIIAVTRHMPGVTIVTRYRDIASCGILAAMTFGR